MTSQFVFFFFLGIAALFLLASRFGQAGRIAEPLGAFRDRAVAVLVWGAPLPESSGSAMTITSVRSVGPGLHIYLQLGTANSPGHLKVAQPGGGLLERGTFIIGSARYVQWSGKRLPQAAGFPAVSITLKE